MNSNKSRDANPFPVHNQPTNDGEVVAFPIIDAAQPPTNDLQPVEAQPITSNGQPRNGSPVESAKKASRSFFQKASAKAKSLRAGMRQKADNAAVKVADVCQDWTGKEMSADDVKRATKIGAVIGSVMAVGSLAGAAMRQARVQQAAQNGQLPNGQASPVDSSQGSNEYGPIGADGNQYDEVAENEMIEQDAAEYDQMKYDQMQDHLHHQDQLNDVVDDQISYSESMDMDMGMMDF